ncbi:MAG: sigma 54-interacting transcriptional regulator [Deltaproteobacteria bacterium]|jgi:PAS domain S-box-containing protein|nr:sigma 54-interacting transcriptional regulator [Deltaproteobacteria bacterium]
MSDLIRILLVDDDEDDFLLTREMIQETGGRFVVEWISTYRDAIRAIKNDTHDVYLIDYHLGHRDGLDLVRSAIAGGCKAPLIMMTGAGDRRVDMAALAAGAADYLVKERLSAELLERSIRYALERKRNEHLLHQASERLEAQVAARTAELTETNRRLKRQIDDRKRAEQELLEREAQLRASEERYRIICEKSSDGITILQKGKAVFVNPALAGMMKTAADALLESKTMNRFQGFYGEKFESCLKLIDQRKRATSFKAPTLLADGREIWTEWKFSPMEWEGKQACLATVRDITETKARETAVEMEAEHLRASYDRLKASIKEHYRFGDMVGKSSAMQVIYDFIMNASKSDASVVIEGESGTGKELVAREIHNLSDRAKGPFVPVNCGAIPKTLFESEFFGHKRGAFTGANIETHGFFGLSQGGTLFLDEVGELSPGMQVKLLRAIEGGGYSQVGSSVTLKRDVRIMAATNRDLAALVKAGAMREDFFYRIHVVGIRLPPLRDRKDDIPLLIDHFTRLHYGSEKPQTIPGHLLGELFSHDWPGNVRELQNVLHRYFAVKRIDFLEGPLASAKPEAVQDKEVPIADGVGLRQALEAFEKQYISQVLDRNRWHKVRTAVVLEIPERTFYRKLKRYRLI